MVHRFVRNLIWKVAAVLVGSILPAIAIGDMVWAAGPESERADYVRVTSKDSLIHLGSLDSFDITESGKRAAQYILNALEKDDMESARAAIEIYKGIIPNENFGGEYTALQWFCEYLLAPKEEKEQLLNTRFNESFYAHLAENNYAVLKEFLKVKYHLEGFTGQVSAKSAQRYRFMEDFVLFANPRRETWEKSSKILEVLNLKKGDKIADIGSGPGYYTFKFAEIVGETGRVYALDNNDMHNDYVSGLAKKLGITNIEIVEPDITDIGVTDKVDCAFMCSLYHIIYTTSTDSEKDGFIASIRNCLKSDGTFVVIDNDLVYDKTLPYHGPYIARDLIVTQLKHHGFKLVATHQFIPQRYVLVFKLDPEFDKSRGEGSKPSAKPFPTEGIVVRDKNKLPPSAGYCQFDALDPERILITSKASLVRCLKTATSPGFTERGRKAASLFLNTLRSKDPAALQETIKVYDGLIPQERYGDEYTAFQWFCEYLRAPEDQRKRMLEDKTTAEYFNYLSGDDFALLKKYVKNKYYLEELGIDMDQQPEKAGEHKKRHRAIPMEEKKTEVSEDQITAWGDFIAFNNPRREDWEKTSRILDFVQIKPGEVVADIGSGPGYYTFKFADLVGKSGRVYAIDTTKEYLDYVTSVASKYGIENIAPVHSKGNDISMPAESFDVAFLCSLYHAIYITSMEYVKDQFIESIRKGLRKDGRLIIVDNSLLAENENPYYGPGIAKELIIAQLKQYGFELDSFGQFIPQRYILVFKKAESLKTSQAAEGRPASATIAMTLAPRPADP